MLRADVVVSSNSVYGPKRRLGVQAVPAAVFTGGYTWRSREGHLAAGISARVPARTASVRSRTYFTVQSLPGSSDSLLA